jgi:hypothetical protein
LFILLQHISIQAAPHDFSADAAPAPITMFKIERVRIMLNVVLLQKFDLP